MLNLTFKTNLTELKALFLHTSIMSIHCLFNVSFAPITSYYQVYRISAYWYEFGICTFLTNYVNEFTKITL